MSLIGLPKNYRFLVKNQLGEALAPNSLMIQLRRSKFDTNGNLIYSDPTTYTNANTIANGTFGAVNSAGISNTDSYWLSADGLLIIGSTGAASGSISLYFQSAPDSSGNTWPTDSQSAIMDIVTYTSTVVGGLKKDFYI